MMNRRKPQRNPLSLYYARLNKFRGDAVKATSLQKSELVVSGHALDPRIHLTLAA
jgi:hypothetical protein